jgi:hypothetical protein
LPKYICRIISTIKKTNIGSILLPNRGPPLCDYARPIGLLPTEPEQLLEMTELVPRPVLCVEVFCNHIGAATLGGLATSGECLQLHNRLPWKPWRPPLERTHDRCLSQRLRRLAHKCTGPPLLNGSTSLPPHHSNSHPLFLCKHGPPWPIEKTKRWTLCPVLLLCSQHFQVWFLRHCGHMCLSLCMFTELPFCSALLACSSINVYMLRGSL